MAAYLQFVEQQQEFSDFCEQLLFRKFTQLQLFTGSCFELPVIYFIENFTDVDNIRYRKNICAIEKDATAPNNFKGTALIIQSEGSHHGYARLYFKNNNMPYTYAMLPEDRPALSEVLLEKSEITTGLFSDSTYTSKWLATFQGLSCDTVDAIWCPNWPEEAHEWMTRGRPNEWPLPSIVKEIVSEGCFLVAKPHQGSQFIANEWRFSFSEAELLLIHSWNDVQMHIYHILRMIKSDVVSKCGGKMMTVLTTYHFKTLMFWACEEKSKKFWLPYKMESSVKELLIIMIEWLTEKQCRNYFQPGNNILDHLQDSDDFEREIQFLIDSVNLVDQYISNTVPFASNCKNKRLKEFPLRIPTNLLFAGHMRASLWYIVDPFRHGRQMYKQGSDIGKSHLFRSDIFDLFQCLKIHRRLTLAKDLEEKLNGLHEIEECFKRANEKHIDGFMHVHISPMDNFHTIIGKVLSKTIDSSDSIDSFKGNVQHVESIPLLRNSTRWELCYSRTENNVAFILEMFVNIINEKVVKPSCFHTAAYEANFYWTIFEEERSDMAVDRYQKALAICNKWLSYAITV